MNSITVVLCSILLQAFVHAQLLRNLASCYTVQRNCQVTGLDPIQRKAGIPNAPTCLQLCLKTNGCRAATYEAFRYTCNFYAETASSSAGTLIQAAGVDYYELEPNCFTTKAPTTTEAITTTLPPLPDGAVCDDDKTMVFFSSMDKRLASAVVAEFKDIETLKQCVALCRKNKDPDNQIVACFSVGYDDPESICKFYRDKTVDRDGDADLVNAEGVIYAEKACIDRVDECPSPPPDVFAFEPMKLLIGTTTEELSADSFEECLKLCMERTPECKSGHYFSDDGECNLKELDAQSDPDLFDDAGEEDEDVIYFENGCIPAFERRTRLRDAVDVKKARWSKWTRCKLVEPGAKTKFRVRSRKCNSRGRCYQYRRCRFDRLMDARFARRRSTRRRNALK